MNECKRLDREDVNRIRDDDGQCSGQRVSDVLAAQYCNCLQSNFFCPTGVLSHWASASGGPEAALDLVYVWYMRGCWVPRAL